MISREELIETTFPVKLNGVMLYINESIFKEVIVNEFQAFITLYAE